MKPHEEPTFIVPTDEDRHVLEKTLLDAAEKLLAQLTDDEWELLRKRLDEIRRRKRPFQFDQRIGYFV